MLDHRPASDVVKGANLPPTEMSALKSWAKATTILAVDAEYEQNFESTPEMYFDIAILKEIDAKAQRSDAQHTAEISSIRPQPPC